MKGVTGSGRVRVQEQAIEGNDPHGGYERLCKEDRLLFGVSQGIVEVKLLCCRWLSPFLKLV